MEKTILVLTNSMDGIHSDIVVKKLEERGEKVFRLDVDKIANGEIEITLLTDKNHFDFKISSQNNCFHSSEIKSIWYRRPNNFNLKMSDWVQKVAAEKELKSFLEGLWIYLENKGIFYINSPTRLEIARKKILQLWIARQIGFQIPSTIITNCPKKVKDFYQLHNEQVIFKTLDQCFIDYGNKSFNIPTTLITKTHLEKIDLIKKLPSLFQHYIDKYYELRITVVGNKIFPISIDSQSISETKIDWRHPKFINQIKYEVVKLPESINKLCLLMMKKLELRFGAFDFIVDKNNNYIFLELNSNGQWYWLEHIIGAKISDAVCNLLANAGKD